MDNQVADAMYRLKIVGGDETEMDEEVPTFKTMEGRFYAGFGWHRRNIRNHPDSDRKGFMGHGNS